MILNIKRHIKPLEGSQDFLPVVDTLQVSDQNFNEKALQYSFDSSDSHKLDQSLFFELVDENTTLPLAFGYPLSSDSIRWNMMV